MRTSQTLQFVARSDSIDFALLIKRGANEIMKRWLQAVHEDVAIPSSAEIGEPLLIDAVPLVLDEILRVIELDDSKIEHEQICSAARHGRDRAQERFEVRELVREYQLLREQIFIYLQRNVTQFTGGDAGDAGDIFRRVGLALDEAMRETIRAFVDEHMIQLRHLSRTDSLTGLYNHRLFYERLEDELNRAKRYDSPLSIVLIDLDNFKTVNDTKGHQFGDQLLVRCAECLHQELRQTDIICRYGGDEFGVILTETTPADAHALMHRLSNVFREIATNEGAPASFGMSFGISAHPEDDGTVAHLVKAADERLLLSKQRNKVKLAPVHEGQR